MNASRVYIHIPFCVSKCLYCDFFSVPTETVSAETVKAYKDALIREMNGAGIDGGLKSVYIGGGTPTCLPSEYLLEIIAAAHAAGTDENTEITVEINPGVRGGKAEDFPALLFDAGVNRLSIGLQTTDNMLLNTLGRVHTYSDFLGLYTTARAAGFKNISVDLMYALPGQSPAALNADIDRILELSPEHISAYPITHEENTPFRRIPPADENVAASYYETIKQKLTSNGYIHYEISNYARKGCESRHNTAYWMREPYIGIGAGAHSFTGGMRFSNTPDIAEYAARKEPVREYDPVSADDAAEEFIFLGLRLLKGISARAFKKEFGVELIEMFESGIAHMLKEGLLESVGDVIRLTDKGVLLSNYVFLSILSSKRAVAV